jgi:hypothetical protein
MVRVWLAALRPKDNGSAGQRVGVSVARVSKLGEPCFRKSRYRRADEARPSKQCVCSWGWMGMDGDGQGEWMVKKVAAEASPAQLGWSVFYIILGGNRR